MYHTINKERKLMSELSIRELRRALHETTLSVTLAHADGEERIHTLTNQPALLPTDLIRTIRARELETHNKQTNIVALDITTQQWVGFRIDMVVDIRRN
jgi:hypothetical protein